MAIGRSSKALKLAISAAQRWMLAPRYFPRNTLPSPTSDSSKTPQLDKLSVGEYKRPSVRNNESLTRAFQTRHSNLHLGQFRLYPSHSFVHFVQLLFHLSEPRIETRLSLGKPLIETHLS